MNCPFGTVDPTQPFAIMVEHVREYAIFLIDRDGRIVSWNPGAQKMKGYAAREIIGQRLDVLYTDEQREQGIPEHNLEVARRDGTYIGENWRRKKDGSLFWALIEIIRIDDASGMHTSFCKVTKDLTQRKLLQDELLREKIRAQAILSAIGDAVLSVDAEDGIDFLNPKAEELSGWASAELRGRDFHELLEFSGTSGAAERLTIPQLYEGRAFTEACPAVLKARDGTRCIVDGVAAPQRTPSGEIDGCVIVFRDATKSREHAAALKHQATHDSLTGLANRAGFDLSLERSIERTRESATSSALIYIDLDGFKAVNDSAGHATGDEMLRRVAQVVSAHTRERDTLARLGGDEFALLIDGCSREVADTVATKLCNASDEFTITFEGQPLKFGASIGVAMIDAGDTPAEVLRRADHACYSAKFGGGNRVYFPRLN